MNMSEAVRTVLNKYATFSGRARRAEYWWWTLALIIASIAVSLIDSVAFPAGMGSPSDFQGEQNDYDGPLSTILSLATLLPSLAVGVRRLHDVGKSGWWLLIILVPLFGIFYLLYLNVQKGDAATNLYGPDPLNPHGSYPAQDSSTFSDDALDYSPLETEPSDAPDQPDNVSETVTDTRPASSESTKKASWRTPSIGKGKFQSTQDRFRDK